MMGSVEDKYMSYRNLANFIQSLVVWLSFFSVGTLIAIIDKSVGADRGEKCAVRKVLSVIVIVALYGEE